MFPYQDPTGTSFLASQGALDAYRSKLHRRYEAAAQEAGTRFVTLEKFQQLRPGVQPQDVVIPWEAFPIKQAGSSDTRIDRDRSELQEEYVEWNLETEGSEIKTITFTTEFPEYFEALADVNFDALVAGLKEIIPDANPSSQELLGLSSPPSALIADGLVGGKTWTVLNRVTGMPSESAKEPFLLRGDRGNAVARLQERLHLLNLVSVVDGDFGPGTERAVIKAQQTYTGAGHFFQQQLSKNPWNNGQNGIYCMLQRFNTLPFLFNLVTLCSVPKNASPQEMCGIVDPECVPERNSDPIVCSTAQRAVQGDSLLSLKDPAGIRIVEMKGLWRVNGTPIEINDPASNQGIWTVSRGGRRGVLRLVPGLELDGLRSRTGSQVARKLMVGADVLVASASDFQ